MEEAEKIGLLDAVEEIAERRKRFGEAVGTRNVAAWLMDEAVKEFCEGVDDLAITYRALARLLNERADKLLDEWREINKNEAEFYQVVERYEDAASGQAATEDA